VTAGARRAALDAVAEEVRTHSGCGLEACETATRPVPGEGPADARVAFVGEAPGASEDRRGRPFVGAAGRVLSELLERAGLRREDVYVTNVVKSRPPGNRTPRAAEVRHMLPWLERELEIVAPELVVPLGASALAVLAPGAKISEVHGTAIEGLEGRRLFPLYHPASALHRPALRETLAEDAEALGRALG
jgi:DNA polymerase